ncbi:hypothetical protein NHX12_010150 [Muraenolepis orangiensis]|uniref:Uncharacterized protein n=1 Tax=Muraenolepis orangiensis TaxID=630683 RepID=A0A9Q0DIK1_9TELE|nr:hypothetical protein NHX12_010150 [Muraenolepis orangiensis]
MAQRKATLHPPSPHRLPPGGAYHRAITRGREVVERLEVVEGGGGAPGGGGGRWWSAWRWWREVVERGRLAAVRGSSVPAPPGWRYTCDSVGSFSSVSLLGFPLCPPIQYLLHLPTPHHHHHPRDGLLLHLQRLLMGGPEAGATARLHAL